MVEEWKWRGVPVWERDGIICTGETYKAVVKMTFAKGAALDDPSGLFNSSLEGNVRRAIDIREGDMHAGVPDSIAQALSAREVEVLLLLDEHLGTDEIAARLFISEHTVRSHVKSLLRKLEVSSRREALEALAQARGDR